MAHTIAVLSQKGGTGKTTTVRTLTDVLRRCGVRTLAVDLDPQGNLSDYFDLPTDAEPTIADVLSGRSTAAKAIQADIIPANLTLAEAELMLGGKIGRELTLKRALAKRAGRLRGGPDRLPALAGAADRQRAGRRRLRADHRRGPVLRAAGRRAGDGGGRAGARQPQPRPLAAGRPAEPRRHAHRPLARGAGLAEGALRGEGGLRHRHARLDRLRRVGRAGDARSSITAPTWAPTTSPWRPNCSSAWPGSRPRASGSRPSAQSSPT